MPADAPAPAPPAREPHTPVPEYADLARVATLLNPEPGDPGERESSLGGTPLWPANEPWPYCAQEGHWTFRPGSRP
ncbi:hypothetical protein ABZX82_08945 [Streptomyces griseoflavus]|uniref:hypothetical protein n=1 Tax=Streptomyces griseoflavus TaxID=35619 RepID=UPI0033A3CA2E